MTAVATPIGATENRPKAPRFKTGILPALGEALTGVLALSPPPTPKGRYALAKAAEAIEPKVLFHQKEQNRLINDHATKDEKDKPLVKMTVTKQGHALSFTPADPEAFQKAMADIDSEEVVLIGCRMITHAELGDCPITTGQEKMLIKAGLLEDREPE